MNYTVNKREDGIMIIWDDRVLYLSEDKLKDLHDIGQELCNNEECGCWRRGYEAKHV